MRAFDGRWHELSKLVSSTCARRSSATVKPESRAVTGIVSETHHLVGIACILSETHHLVGIACILATAHARA